MRRRLLISYLSLAVAVLVALEVPLGVLAARREHEQLTSAARRDAVSLAVLAQEALEHPEAQTLDSLATSYRGETGAEVAVLDSSGRPLVRLNDKEQEPFASDLPPEAARALAGQISSGSHDDEGHPTEVVAVPVRRETTVEGAVVVALPAADVLRRITLMWLALGGLAAVVLLLTSIVGFRLARWVTRPLGELETAAAALGRGELGVRAAPLGPPEARALAATFNEMAGRLEELVGAQRRFVADASHQLRSPLTALRLRLENLAAGDDPDPAADLGAASDEVARLSRIVDGLLTLSSAEGVRPQREAVDVSALIVDRRAAWSALAEERGVSLGVEGANDAPVLAWAVPGHLEQILDNLLANALEATPRGKSIVMSVAGHNGKLELHVRDEGPGMTADERAHAFDRLWQGAGRKGGAGLGLSIVAQLARSSGGECQLREAGGGGLDVELVLEATRNSA